MTYVPRTLDLRRLLSRKSHFLFGPRGTGKTRLIRETLPGAPVIDLLSDDVYSRLLRRPSALVEMLPPRAPKGGPVVIDEVQKLPALLDEVHRLIELSSLRFLLTGSSARKLKRGAANLLGGRAWEARLFPLTSAELELGDDLDLTRFLNTGGLPAVYFADSPSDELRAYARLYLKEEIQAESLVRRFDHFARFLDVAALVSGEELNFEAVASDAGVPARTVASYFEILEDTLLGFQVHSFRRTKLRKAIKRSKFYIFDVGVAGALARRGQIEMGSSAFGKAFEHFLVQEVRAYLSYRNLDLDLCYWRSTSQQEVDVVVGTELAIEIKATERIGERHVRGLIALREEKLVKRHLVVSRDPVSRTFGSIRAIPWRQFLSELWSDALIS
jgi:predicted AAA+ superfamily ATPase